MTQLSEQGVPDEDVRQVVATLAGMDKLVSGLVIS